jgi:hypothetical protein
MRKLSRSIGNAFELRNQLQSADAINAPSYLLITHGITATAERNCSSS